MHKSIELINNEGRGVLILIRDSGQSIISNLITSRDEKTNKQKNNGNENDELRIYGMGAQILSELGVKKMILLTNTEWKFIGLDAYDISIVETRLLSDI